MVAIQSKAILKGIDIIFNGSDVEVSGTDFFGKRFSGRFDKKHIIQEGLLVRIKAENYERGKPINHAYRYFVAPISGQFDGNEYGVMVQYDSVEILKEDNKPYRGKGS